MNARTNAQQKRREKEVDEILSSREFQKRMKQLDKIEKMDIREKSQRAVDHRGDISLACMQFLGLDPYGAIVFSHIFRESSRGNFTIRNEDISKAYNLSLRTTEKKVSYLKKKGVIEITGSTRKREVRITNLAMRELLLA